MQFSLTIQCDNAAFDGSLNNETARILRDLARRLGTHDDEGSWALHDLNGNRIGTAEFAEGGA